MNRPTDHSGQEVFRAAPDRSGRKRWLAHHWYWRHERVVNRDAWSHAHPHEWLWHEFMWRVGWHLLWLWVFRVVCRGDRARWRAAGVEGQAFRIGWLVGRWA